MESQAEYISEERARLVHPGRRLGAPLVGLGVGLGVALAILLFLLPPGMALAGAAAAGLAVASLAYPVVAAMAYIAVQYVRPGETVGGVGALRPEILVVSLGIVCIVLLKVKLRERIVPKSRLHLPLAALYVAMLVGVPWAYWRLGALQTANVFGKFLVGYLIVIALTRSRRHLRWVVWAFVACMIWQVAAALTGYATGGRVYALDVTVNRAMGATAEFSDPDDLANLLVIALPFLVFLVPAERGLRRMALLAAAGATLILILLTGSRGGFVGIAAIALFLTVRSRRRLLAVAALVAVASVAWLALGAPHRARILSLQDYRTQSTFIQRKAAWAAAGQMIRDRPLFGVGGGNFKAAYALEYSPAGEEHWLSPHSLYYQIGAELGLVGAVAFAALVFFLFREIWRVRRRLDASGARGGWEWQLTLACEAALVGSLVVGIVAHNLFRFSWCFIAALVVVLSRIAADLGPETPSEAPANPPASQPAGG